MPGHDCVFIFYVIKPLQLDVYLDIYNIGI